MALNFPASPTLNQVFTSGTRSWLWDGSSWVANNSVTNILGYIPVNKAGDTMSGGLNVPNVNAVTVTANSSGFSIAGGSSASKTLTVSNGVTIAGTDGSTLNIGAGGTLLSGAFQASSQGTTGAQGVQGTTGSQGAQGTDGVQGNTGAQGTQGITGPNGIQGATGTQGSIGTQGTAGYIGADGAQGTQGITGSQGAIGTQGAVGSTGGTGATGNTGVQGSTGAQGTQGAQGLKGTQIASAVSPPASPAVDDLWWNSDLGILMIYYYDGDSYQWVTTSSGIVGPQGTTGLQGAAGSQGATGSQGTQGTTGAQGATGSQGTQGTSGASILGTANTWTNTNAFTSVSASSGLTVTGNVDATSTFRAIAGAGGVSQLNFVGNTGNLNAQIQYDQVASNSGQLFFGTNNAGTFATRLTLTKEGDVGIGVTPTQRLDIATASGDCIIRLGNGTSTARFAVDNDGPYIYPLTAGDNSLRVFTPAGGTAMLIDASGNVGINVTPSAWDTYKSLELPNTGYISSGTSWLEIMMNTYYGSGAYRYKGTGTASHYLQQSGAHIWYNAASGTAGNAISFTQRMTLDASGNLGVGTTSTTGKINVLADANGTGLAIIAGSASANTASIRFGISSDAFSNGVRISAHTNYSATNATEMSFATCGSASGTLIERVRIDSSGNVGIGTTSPAAHLHVYGSGEQSIYNQSTTTHCFFRQIPNSGANAYIDNATVGSTIYFRTSASSSCDTAPVAISSTGLAVTGAVSLTTTLSLTNSSTSADVMLSRPSTALGATVQYKTGATLNWYHGTRGLSDNNWYLFNNNLSTNTLIFDYSNDTATFAGKITAKTGNASSGVFNGNFNGSTEDGINLGDTVDASNAVFINFRKSNGTSIGSIRRVTTTDAVVYNTSSDGRLKENLRDFTDSGRLIDSLKPRVFDWKNSDENGKNVVGFIAQEEHAADPMFAHIGAVSVGDEDPETITKQWQRSDSALIPILVAELQSVRQRLAALESK